MKKVNWDLIDIGEEKDLAAKHRVSLSPRIKLKHKRIFFSTFAKLLHGGIPILRALEIFGNETRKENIQSLIPVFQDHIRQGKSLSYCLSLYPAVFPVYQISLIQAGEASGQLDKVLEDIALGLEKEEETRSKVREAVSYPAFIIIFGLITIFVLTAFIIPKLALVYQDFGETLPWITRLVIRISDTMKYLLPLFILFVGGFFLLIRRYGKRLYPVALALPLLGSILRHSMLVRFSYLLSLLLKSGIPLLRALEAMDEKTARERIASGETLTQALRELPFVNETALALIQAGEESGTLPESLEEVSEVYSRELEAATKVILKLLEPALILGVGIVTGFVVIAMIYPVVTLSSAVR
ncbi:MAG: hypothetical protein A2036_04325 [Omnitrophica bacterium GWA2_50_21]|nr:MAG: hypothetical protein A2036_04325 [Omnitrophica bacterium GWA2_50_21]